VTKRGRFRCAKRPGFSLPDGFPVLRDDESGFPPDRQCGTAIDGPGTRARNKVSSRQLHRRYGSKNTGCDGIRQCHQEFVQLRTLTSSVPLEVFLFRQIANIRYAITTNFNKRLRKQARLRSVSARDKTSFVILRRLTDLNSVGLRNHGKRKSKRAPTRINFNSSDMAQIFPAAVLDKKQIPILSRRQQDGQKQKRRILLQEKNWRLVGDMVSGEGLDAVEEGDFFWADVFSNGKPPFLLVWML